MKWQCSICPNAPCGSDLQTHDIHMESPEHKALWVARRAMLKQRRAILPRIKECDSTATLSLIARILDGGEQATQDTIGALRDESLRFGDDEQPDVADRLRALAGMP